jgi:hypothetical protein
VNNFFKSTFLAKSSSWTFFILCCFFFNPLHLLLMTWAKFLNDKKKKMLLFYFQLLNTLQIITWHILKIFVLHKRTFCWAAIYHRNWTSLTTTKIDINYKQGNNCAKSCRLLFRTFRCCWFCSTSLESWFLRL